ncbi:DUF1127 domain-containing protein [Limimaricola sp. AA108-03]|uniref:DUF1127 domain-containing protein n=1 Tax=Limimaricola sp. AA108-03 TaxID=3425945 RepID=UPI003D76D3AC
MTALFNRQGESRDRAIARDYVPGSSHLISQRITPVSATVTATPVLTAAPAGFVARLRTALRGWFARRQTVCDLALLSDEDLAHLGISSREIHDIRRIARFEAPFTPRPAEPIMPRTSPLGLLTSAALRR